MKGAFLTLSALAYTANGAPLSSRSIANINLGNPLGGLLGQLTNGIAGSVLSMTNGAANGVVDTTSNAANNVANTANGAVSNAAGTLGGTANNAVNTANNAVNTANGAVNAAGNTANNAVNTANNAINTANGAVNNVESTANNAVNNFANAAGNVGNTLAHTAGNMVDDVAQGTEQTIASVASAVDSIEQTVARVLASIESAAQAVSNSAVNTANGISGQAVAAAENAANNAIGTTKTTADQLVDNATNTLKNAGSLSGNVLPKPDLTNTLPKLGGFPNSNVLGNVVHTPCASTPSAATPHAVLSTILPETIATAADPAAIVNMFPNIMISLGLNGAISAAPKVGADGALAAANLGLNTAKSTDASIQNLIGAFGSFAKALHEKNALVNSTVEAVKAGKYSAEAGANDVLNQYNDIIEHMSTLSKAIVDSGNGDIIGNDLSVSQDLINNIVGQCLYSVRYAMSAFDSNPTVRGAFHSAVSYLNQSLLAAATLHQTLATPIYAALAPVVATISAFSAIV